MGQRDVGGVDVEEDAAGCSPSCGRIRVFYKPGKKQKVEKSVEPLMYKTSFFTLVTNIF